MSTLTPERWLFICQVADVVAEINKSTDVGATRKAVWDRLGTGDYGKIGNAFQYLKKHGYLSSEGAHRKTIWFRTGKPLPSGPVGGFPGLEPTAALDERTREVLKHVWHSRGVNLDVLAQEALREGHVDLFWALRNAAGQAMALLGD